MKFGEFLERFIYVRKCVGCNERMGYEHREEAFCNACRISWERAKADICPECSVAMSDCRCIPSVLSRSGAIELRKLVAYRKAHISHPENKLIYFLKNKKSKRVALFAARQLLCKIDELFAANDESKKSVVLTYIPRSKRAYSKFGVDQAKLVCETLAEVSGIPCIALIERKSGKHREQKSLDANRRMINAESSFEINEELAFECKGKSVILFDDIVTTGASMVQAVRILRRSGIKKIYGLSLAYSVKEKS